MATFFTLPAGRRRDLVVIGASAGGVEVLRDMAAGLPAGLPACVLVVLHIGVNGSRLADILDRSGPLPAAVARQGEHLRPGHIFVAPPDHHLMVEDGVLMLTRDAKEKHSRPAIDPLMRSAAVWHGPSVIGVLLSGGNDDGTAGLQAIAQAGGITVVQDPSDADVPFMPASALRNVRVNHCIRGQDLAATIVELVSQRCVQDGATEAALWAGIQALREKEDLMRRMAALDRTAGDEQKALTFEANAAQLFEQAKLLRALVSDLP